MDTSKIKVIAFDADDTLWVNEPFFREIEDKFCDMLKDQFQYDFLQKELFATEMANLSLYGYGVKAFTLSLLETLLRVTNHTATAHQVETVINLGKELLNRTNPVLDHVNDTLHYLHQKGYQIVLATKGDLLDQQRKLQKSGLQTYFNHIQVMADKQASDYQQLLDTLKCTPQQFLMIGNSLKSDILPVLQLGASAIHIPFHTTWLHEHVDTEIQNPQFLEFKSISQVQKLF